MVHWLRKRIILGEIEQECKNNNLVKVFESKSKLGKEYLRIRFNNGIVERWIVESNSDNLINSFHIDFNNAIGYDPPTYCEFESDPLDDNKQLEPFFAIQKDDIAKAGFVNLRFKVHRLVNKLLEEGWVDYSYPKSVLVKDYNKIRKTDPKSLWISPVRVFARFKNTPLFGGRLIIENFTPYENIRGGRSGKSVVETWSDPIALWQAINAIIKAGKDVTRGGIIKKLQIFDYRRRCGVRMPNPVYWYSIINKISPGDKILDIDPWLGAKAIATSVANKQYYYENNQFDMSELLDFLPGKSCRSSDQYYDLAILSRSDPLSKEQAVDVLSKNLSRAKKSIILVNKEDVDFISDHFEPNGRIYTQPYIISADHYTGEKIMLIY